MAKIYFHSINFDISIHLLSWNKSVNEYRPYLFNFIIIIILCVQPYYLLNKSKL